jgi:ribosomal RNA-processing protein 1
MSSSSSSSSAADGDEGQRELARRLAHTDKPVRDAAFAAVSEWLVRHRASGPGGNAGADARVQMMKMWKALFYCVWMSDKPAVQAELVQAVAELPRKLEATRGKGKAASNKDDSETASSRTRAVLFFECAFATLRREWMGLDRYRVDKYLLLLRRLVHELLVFCGGAGGGGWTGEHARRLLGDGTAAARHEGGGEGGDSSSPAWESRAGILVRELMSRRPNGLRLHVADLYAEELAKACPGIDTAGCLAALAPMLAVLRDCDDRTVFDRVRGEVFGAEGASDGGEASLLRRMREETEEEEEGEKGEAPFRNVRASAVARALFSIGADESTRGGHREAVYDLHKEFAAVARGPREGAGDADVVAAVAVAAKKEKGKEKAVAVVAEAAAAEEEEEEEEEKKAVGGKKGKGKRAAAAAAAPTEEAGQAKKKGRRG